MNCFLSIRGLHFSQGAAIAATPFAVGLPFLCVQYALFGPANRLLAFLTSHFCLSADALTAALMTLWFLLFGAALFAGDRFLRRFLGL